MSSRLCKALISYSNRQVALKHAICKAPDSPTTPKSSAQVTDGRMTVLGIDYQLTDP